MTTTLIAPNDPYKRPRPVARVNTARLMVALDCTQVTAAVRWFSFDALYAVSENRRDLDYLLPIQACLTPDEYAAGLAAIASSAEAAKARKLVVTLTPDMAANVNHALNVEIRIVPEVSLWHEGMKSA